MKMHANARLSLKGRELLIGGKSDSPVVPAKLSNEPGRPGAEVVEGRGAG